LRGCGLQDWELEAAELYNPGLRPDQRTYFLYEIDRILNGNPIMFHSVFISYSTQDQAFAYKLHSALQANGVRCWFAAHDAKSGRKLHQQIEGAIQLQDKLLLILSKGSMSSQWVATEIANAREKEKKQGRQMLHPIRLVPFEVIRDWKLFDADLGKDSAREIREYFIPDFSELKHHRARRPRSRAAAVRREIRKSRNRAGCGTER
jgi:TIR domain-containing protein